jgi:hypothetical protein
MFFVNLKTPLHKTPTIDESKIQEHNLNNPWKQGGNQFFESSTLADAKKIMTTAFASHNNLIKCNIQDTIIPPSSFDSRKEWPSCVSPILSTKSKIKLNKTK